MILSKQNIDNINLDELVNGKIASGKLKEILFVVPTNRKLRKFKKEIITNSPKQAATKINIETLNTLTSKILRQSKSFVQLSEAASTVMIEQSAAEAELQYFTNYGGSIPSGTLDKLRSVFYEYKRRGIAPESLLKDLSALKENEREKAKDISNIYSVYIQKCKSLNAFEIGDIYSQILELDKKVFVQNMRQLFPAVKTISVSGFDEFTMPEIEILDQISNIDNILLFVNFDYNSTNLNLFSHLDECFGRLIYVGFKEQNSEFKKIDSEFIKEIKNKLFSYQKKTAQKNEDNKTIIVAQTKEAEVELIAKEIKNLVFVENVNPGKIAVVFNLIEHYSFLIRDVFSSYGIPFNLTDRLSLSNSYPIIALINFLEILENDFYYKNLMRSLHSGFIDLEKIDVTNLAAVAKKLKIVAGKNTWEYRIGKAISNFKLTNDEYSIRKIKKLKLAESNIAAISKLLIPFSVELTVVEFKNELLKLINNLKIPERILTNSQSREEENFKSLSVLIETLDEIFLLQEQDEGVGVKHNLKFYLNQIRTAAGWARYNIKEKSNYGVLVTTLDEIRGLKYDYLFISGMNDGELPTRYSPEIFYSKAFMLKKEKSHLLEQRYRFYQALCNWNVELFLSYSKADNKKDLVESSFLKELKNLYEFKIKSENDYNGIIYNVEETLKEFGRTVTKNDNVDKFNFSKNLTINSEKIEELIDKENTRIYHPFENSVFNGFLSSETENSSEKDYQLDSESAEHLRQYAEKEYSISQLETFGKCPFKYFVERVLKLDIIEEPTEEIEAIEMGSILHSILFEFYVSLREKGFTVADNFNEAKKIIFSIAKKKVDDADFNSPLSFYEKEKIFGLNGEYKKSILYKFLEEEKNNNKNRPSYFEVSFGRKVNDEIDDFISTEEALNIEGVRLRGKIDRVDLDESLNGITVVDYKLGSNKIRINELYRGIQLQLPVYLLAIQKLIASHTNTKFEPLGMEIYSLKYSEKEFGKKPLNLIRKKHSVQETIDENRKLIAIITSFIKEYVKAISLGQFNISTHEDREVLVCKYCDLKKTCRVQNIM